MLLFWWWWKWWRVGGLEGERERVEIEFLLGGVECVGLALFYWASPLSSTIGGLRESGAGQAVQGKEGWGGGGTWRKSIGALKMPTSAERV